MMINREILEGNWNQFKGQILKKWSQLTDSDLAEFHGNVDELVGVIQRKTGEGREVVESFLQNLTAGAATFPARRPVFPRRMRRAAESFRGSARRAGNRGLPVGGGHRLRRPRDRPCQGPGH